KAQLLGNDVLASRDRARQALSLLRQEHGRIGGILHLLPLREAPIFPGLDTHAWSRHVGPELKGLLYLLQALAPELNGAADNPVVVASVSMGGGDFGDRGETEAVHPWRGGLTGLLKTAAKEWPAARFRALDVDAVPEPMALLREVTWDGPVEVGYRRGRRL